MSYTCGKYISAANRHARFYLASSTDDINANKHSRPFQDAVHAGTGSVMCSYNRLNNSYGCSNSKIMNGLLKTELGFQVRAMHLPM